MPIFEVHPDIAQARTLAAEFYTSPQHFEAAKERIFAPSWQYVGHMDELIENGSALPITLLENCLDEPLVLVRDAEARIRCLSNVCTHRGNILVNSPCRVDKLRCRYHGRQFRLDGRFASMPEFSGVKDFPSAADDLCELPLHQWGKLLFAGLERAPADAFPPMEQRMQWSPMDQLVFRPDLSTDHVVHANWALYVENYLEGFHIPFVHPALNAVLDFSDYTTELYSRSSLQLGIATKDELCFDIPPGHPDHGKKVAAYYWWVFPNLMFNFYPWGLSLNIVQPQGVSLTKVSFLAFVRDESKLGKGAGAGLVQVEKEDEQVVEAVQRGIRSRHYTHGRYSVTREQGTHHFHRLIAAAMG
ncbi:MAG: aromatic ring-hydroxylating dioxygenase subunit alpha [Flavobacteriales bacterium]|nr:aromatic ring-hydroxylating dioxygenase subunit alpha [Flavobacteriales bacterium]MBK7270242.1 aromatic ring-hydroxylating dioxygenase subunit alpha [Flavobacteriales bacterium]MBK7754098.1 aromatic ring-hydroxylating dioxygenase subunit alpha [Flavobacteriales bacterium]MBK9075914.1 aromatic ring-hydroxylating dioxygenase subunit alpha [Flavobacteriales bacterium]MBK9537320.1 aromatic ring-hydroxylating dioxygenase subunit alpha [Flavobacteriales bacterium]